VHATQAQAFLPGLLGAHAFVEENPLARGIGLVLNFEARGSSGPVILFETSDENAWLIDNVSKSASHPVANSLSYEIYKRLPNDTDFTVFKRAGYPGLNFAFIDGLVHYHTATDTLANLDLSSLQHDGDYAVELGGWFGNLAEIQPPEGRAVYFDILSRVLVHYSPVTSAGCLLPWIFFRGFKQRYLTLLSLLLSVFVTIGGVIAAIAVALALQRFIGMLLSRASMLDGGIYVIAFAALTFAIDALLYRWAAKRLGPLNMAGAGMLFCSRSHSRPSCGCRE
jgi:hypothetical protein